MATDSQPELQTVLDQGTLGYIFMQDDLVMHIHEQPAVSVSLCMGHGTSNGEDECLSNNPLLQLASVKKPHI